MRTAGVTRAAGALLFSLLFAASDASAQTPGAFLRGADISSLPELEDHGAVFTDAGAGKDLLTILKDRGFNAARLKLWHASDGYNGTLRVAALGQRVKRLGMKFLLDFHYSDTWADPGAQSKPSDWNSLSLPALKDSVYQYTKEVMTLLKQLKALPDIVQLGNEISGGMLWDEGRVGGPFDTPAQWRQFADLLLEARRGVTDAVAPADSVRIMIHIDKGGDNAGCRWFIDRLLAAGFDFDLLGLSYYPWWHGTLSMLSANLADLAPRYGKEIVVVETAYPWSLQWCDASSNLVGGSGQLHAGYPASVAGQLAFLKDEIAIIAAAPGGKGKGIFYWEPAWICAPQSGTPWENCALFDFNGGLLASAAAFWPLSGTATDRPLLPARIVLAQNFPNPFNPCTMIRFVLSRKARVKIAVYDLLGREVAVLVNGELEMGEREVRFDGSGLSSGVYFYRMESGGNAETRTLILLK